MFNSRILLSAASIAAAGALIIGATFAYFSDTETSAGNTFTAGTLEIDITDQNVDTPFASEAIISNWAPGETTNVNFDVKNTGSLPVYLRAAATGSWSDGGDATLVKVTLAEYWDGDSWETFASNSGGLTGWVYYSLNGTDSNWFTVAGNGGRAQIRLTVLFDPSANSTYEGKTFTANLTAQARQTTTGATWP